jgi:hypothetical protein
LNSNSKDKNQGQRRKSPGIAQCKKAACGPCGFCATYLMSSASFEYLLHVLMPGTCQTHCKYLLRVFSMFSHNLSSYPSCVQSLFFLSGKIVIILSRVYQSWATYPLKPPRASNHPAASLRSSEHVFRISCLFTASDPNLNLSDNGRPRCKARLTAFNLWLLQSNFYLELLSHVVCEGSI